MLFSAAYLQLISFISRKLRKTIDAHVEVYACCARNGRETGGTSGTNWTVLYSRKYLNMIGLWEKLAWC